MARATVFVDDAVLGRLPAVCVRTGAPADGTIDLIHRVNRFSPWMWLLVLLGPLGWLGLVLAVLTGGETVSVRLPVSEAAFDEWRGRRRLRWIAPAVAAGTIALTVADLLDARTGMLVLLATLVLGVVV